jgi:uncharacterized protein
VFLGFTLLLAATAMVFKAWLQGQRSAQARRAGLFPPEGGTFAVKVLPTLAIGALGGLLVGLTSVGSGSIIIICLMLLYPTMRGAELVGTDLVQAVPLVTSAAIAHIVVGDFQLALTASILIGAVPAVWLGARMSSKAPDGVIRPALVVVLLASALKLLDMPTTTLGIVLLAFSIIAFPLWGAVDAAAHPPEQWSRAGADRRRWIRWQLLFAPIGIGAMFAGSYFATIRPRLVAAGQAEPLPETMGS